MHKIFPILGVIWTLLSLASRAESDDPVDIIQLGKLFEEGEYQELYERGVPQFNSLTEKSNYAESLNYLLVGSSCFLGKYQECVNYAQTYKKFFHDGIYTTEIDYFKGVALSRLGYFELAEELFSSVTETDNEYQPHARLELYQILYALGKYEECEQSLEKLIEDENAAQIQSESYLLLARVRAVLRKQQEAVSSYNKSLEIARDTQNANQEQETLFYLISYLGRKMINGDENENMADSIPFYREFFEKYPESDYASQVISAVLPALKKSGLRDEGMKVLETIVLRQSKNRYEPGLRKAASDYIWERYEGGEKITSLREFIESTNDSYLRGVYLYALTDIYEAGLAQAGSKWGRKLRNVALINAAYAELLDIPELPSYVSLALGEWLNTDGNFANEARERFIKSTESPILAVSLRAKLGSIRSLRLLSGDENLDQAMHDIEELLNRLDAFPELQEQACYEKIEILAARDQWESVTAAAREYLIDNKNDFREARVSFLLGFSYDQRKLTEDAIAHYSRIFASYIGQLEVSAPTVDRLTTLTWERNLAGKTDIDSDKQIAYQLGHRYLTTIESLPAWKKERPDVKPYLDTIRTNVEAWEASGDVISVEQLLSEMRQGKR